MESFIYTVHSKSKVLILAFFSCLSSALQLFYVRQLQTKDLLVAHVRKRTEKFKKNKHLSKGKKEATEIFAVEKLLNANTIKYQSYVILLFL